MDCSFKPFIDTLILNNSVFKVIVLNSMGIDPIILLYCSKYCAGALLEPVNSVISVSSIMRHFMC